MKQRADFIEKIKKTLLEKREDINKQLAAQTQDKVNDGIVQDSADEALSLSMENLQNSLQKTELGELHLMEEALVRISRGEYGVCIDCGEPISEKRLGHFPYAARCIVCQENFEQ